MRVGGHGVPGGFEPAESGSVADAQPAAQPELPTGKDFNGKPFPAMDYKAISGSLFVNGATPGDVGQGNIGDCFFLSSLAAVARTDPEILERAIRRNRDGSYTVTFKERGDDGKVKDHPVRVDGALPHAGGKPAFGRSLERGELWPAIFEKAFATYKGGYQKIDKGGYGQAALTALTGTKSHYRTLAAVSEEKLWSEVKGALDAKHPVVTGSPDARTLKRLTGRPDMKGLIDGHMYAVLDAFEKGGRRYVKLYTPLRPGDAGGRKDAGREVTLELKEWRRLFDDVVISEA